MPPVPEIEFLMSEADTVAAAILGRSSPAQSEHWIAGSPPPAWRPRLLVREQAPPGGDRSRPILYVHGATFPSASSIMAKFKGRSWADALNDADHDVFGLDFAGFGGSERYPAMTRPATEAEPLGRADEAAAQIGRAVALIRRETGAGKVSIIAHSWGTMPAAIFAIAHPELVDRLILFGPVLMRRSQRPPETHAWSLVTVAEQHQRFVRDVPTGHKTVLEEQDFPDWAETYLNSDPGSRHRNPPAVKIPAGPSADVAAAWSGRLAYDPGRLATPVLIVRGEWDSSSSAADAEWFMAALAADLERRVVTIPQATHLMHLEHGRHALYEAVNAFLACEPKR
jgi:pimeloyl-ACP methyl ester carboxylesterase